MDIDRAEGILDSKEILKDWSENERRTLLRRAIFDPATYGRVRFHHRSVQEYLAACRLKNLREKGMPIHLLLRLFFSESYGIPVVVPSMRAIAAWLALEDENVRRELMAREPETLLSFGDPENLPIPIRKALLRAFVKAYGRGGRRGMKIPIDEVRRLAHADLAETVRECWADGHTNHDVRNLLLELIYQGKIEACMDIAEKSAWDMEYPAYHRIISIQAITACSHFDIARKIAESILFEQHLWPDKVVHEVAPELFPKILTASELVALVERTPEQENSIDGFAWALREIAATVNPWSEEGIQLRDLLTDLIWRGRHQDVEWYQSTSRYGYVSPALAILCDRQFSVRPMSLENELSRACIIAIRFQSDGADTDTIVKQLKAHFAEGPFLREKAFWIDFTILEELAITANEDERLFIMAHKGAIGGMINSDRFWLEKALCDINAPKLRNLALRGLIDLWIQRGRIPIEVEWLQQAVKDDPQLCELLTEWTTPVEPRAEWTRMHRENLIDNKNLEQREKKRLEGWREWREQLIADPARAFCPEKISYTISNLYKWLTEHERRKDQYNVWNQSALEQAFSLDIAQQAATAFKSAWRTNPPPTLWSQRSLQERNTTYLSWCHGLCGLAAEVETPVWAIGLSPEEARIAATYATVELNGFTPWLGDLVKVHPKEVDAILGEELSAELTQGASEQYLPALQNLNYADIQVKKLLAPRCLDALKIWPTVFANEESQHYQAYHLHHLFRILDEVSEGKDRDTIASVCHARFADDSMGPLSKVWLEGLFRFDAERGALVLENHFSSLTNGERSQRAVTIFAALFGERDSSLLRIEDPVVRSEILRRLVLCAHRYVRDKDDLKHDGVFTPTTRDDAETARDYLMTVLLNIPGPQAYNIKIELAKDPLFSDFADRIRLVARERAASDAEFKAYTSSDIAALESNLEIPPHDRDGLFEVMKNRLDDLSHNIAHDDFSYRRTLCAINEECEMQRYLASRLKDMAKGSYVVTREAEKADAKRTDIQLDAVSGNQKAVIEIKIADKRWSLKDLENALRNQLVEQYLRHDTSSAGCLLLTYHGNKRYWVNTKAGTHLNFQELIDYLAMIAKDIEQESIYKVRLAVHGINLTSSPQGSKTKLA